MKKVSVIVPVYNTENYLFRCLDSLVHQSLEEIEIIVVNDGSLDNAWVLMEEYKREYPEKIILVDKENGGLSDARNAGLAIAQGEFIGFVDSDDFCEPQTYEVAYQKAIENQSDIVFWDFYWVFDSGKKDIHKGLSNVSTDHICKDYLLSDPSACNKLFRRTLIENHKIRFPLSLWYEDLATTLALVKYTDNISYINQPLYNYYQRDESIMQQTTFHPKSLDIIKAMENIQLALQNSKYLSEVEYLSSFQLLYLTSLRLLKFHAYEAIESCVKALDSTFPNWKQNEYYVKKPSAYRMYCNFIAKKQYRRARGFIRLRSLLGG